MPLPLTLGNALTAWTIDWPSVICCVLLAAAYVSVARRVRWPAVRTISFLTGLAVVIVCTCSFLGVYDEVLFWTRAVQNVALLMGAPMLIALGAPFSLLRAGASVRTRSFLQRVGHGRVLVELTKPYVVTVALLVPLPLLYFSPLYGATLTNELIDALARLALVLCGFVYYWTRLQIDPTPRGATHLVSFAIGFAEMLVDGALGVIVWLGPVIAHHHYLDVGRSWGPSIRRDQTMGAIALWFGGDIIGIPYLVALFVQWFRDEDRLARKVDAELDREDEARRRREGADPDGGPAPMQSGLWWETDPRLASRPGFGRRDVWPPAAEEDVERDDS